MSNKLPEIEALLPIRPPRPRVLARARETIRASLTAAGSCLIVLDDDPTGTQTVHDVPVYLEWPEASVREALQANRKVAYISTNSRALECSEATALAHQLGQRLRKAEQATGVKPLFASRSDSTLRGHYPEEVAALATGYGSPVDGVLLCPAFFEGGRYTANDIHYVLQGATLIPTAETEFARDPVFGYTHSNLREWVVEKRAGTSLDSVQSITLEDIREGGSERIHDLLMTVTDSSTVIVNAMCYEDLEQFVLGLTVAEQEGKRFIYRCAASFVKIRAGLEDGPLLTKQDLALETGPGLVLVGSWVERTTQQLSYLLEEPSVIPVELNVTEAGSEQQRVVEGAVLDAVAKASLALSSGKTAVVYTSRGLVSNDNFAAMGRRIMTALCQVAARVAVAPSFVVAKGGITSIEIARTAMCARRAHVLGQLADGVPVWRLGEEARWANLPYVVFPGNVGTATTLRDVVRMLL